MKMRSFSRAAVPAIVLLGLILLLGACTPQAGPLPTPTHRPSGPGVMLGNQPLSTPGASQPTPQSATTPIPLARVGPDSYPADVNPLTGLPVPDVAVLNRPPLAIKVSNDPLARPQSGLSFADLVYEHYAEGGVTRYTAIFYSQSAQQVGSVRSGRLLDLEIVPMYDAIYTASGFSDGVLQRMRQANWANRNFSPPFGYAEPYLIRINDPNIAYEHTLFAVPEALWALAQQQGVSQPPDLTPGLLFDPALPAGGTSAGKITINYGPQTSQVRWEYDPATNSYLRWVGGQPDTDKLTGQQLAFENVIAVAAMHVDTDILEDTVAGGHWSIEIQLWGEGPASIFRDGQRFEGRWRRTSPEEMITFTDLSGNPLPLRNGQTWFEVVPIGFDQLSVEP